MAEKTYEESRKQGIDFIIGVANQQSTKLFLKYFNFQNLGQLDVKFGIGRTTFDAAHEIRDGKISRDEGISLVKKYDGEFPKKYFKEFLKYCSINSDDFNKIVDSWRADHIWYKDNEGNWKLKNTVY